VACPRLIVVCPRLFPIIPPSIVVFDQTGHVRLRHFGQIDDLQLGALIGQLLAEAPSATKSDVSSTVADRSDTTACAYGACSVGA
jgi:hypothetical protein